MSSNVTSAYMFAVVDGLRWPNCFCTIRRFPVLRSRVRTRHCDARMGMRLPVHSENNLILDPLFVELVHAKLAGSLVNRMHHEKVSVSSMAALSHHAGLNVVPGYSTRVWRTVLLPILFPAGGNACRYTRSPLPCSRAQEASTQASEATGRSIRLSPVASGTRGDSGAFMGQQWPPRPCHGQPGRSICPPWHASP